jgi:hypothetical protein
MNSPQYLCVEIGEKWRDQLRRGIAVYRVHIHRDSRGLGVRTAEQLDTRDALVSQLRYGHLAMIAGKDFKQLAALLFSHHDGGQKSVALDGCLERDHLFFGEILRVALQRDELVKTQSDETSFIRRAQKSSVPSMDRERHSRLRLGRRGRG